MNDICLHSQEKAARRAALNSFMSAGIKAAWGVIS